MGEFVYLYLIYLSLCITQGIIALLPLNFIKEGFIFYDKKENLKNNNKRPNNGESKCEIKLLKDIYLIFILVSIIVSLVIKLIFDNLFIEEYNYTNQKKVHYYFLISDEVSTFASLFFYVIYIKAIAKQKTIYKNIYTTEIFGYFIYNESIKSEDVCCRDSCYDCCECCEDCSICCDTLNLSLCCYSCSCTYCCKYILCCYCCRDKYKNFKKNNRYKKREIKDINKIQNIYIAYRVTGRWNWIGKIMTNINIYSLSIFLYFILISNMGFEERIWNNYENNKNKNKIDYMINFYSLIWIVICYAMDKIGNKVFGKFFERKEFQSLKEYIPQEIYYIIFSRFFYYIIVQLVISIAISGTIYFNDKNDKFELSFGIGSIEYIKILILENISFLYDTNYNLGFFSCSTIFSAYLLIWDIILTVLDVLEIENKSIIYFQFLFGLSFLAILIFFLFYVLIIPRFKSKENNKNERAEIQQDTVNVSINN